jgi:organic hydroperoxide reductase OsmC/OhrA
MQPLPHLYSVAAASAATGTVALTAAGLPRLTSAAPSEFGGPGDRWSPELLLAAAVVSCFVLTFRAVARASQLEWTQLECNVDATLDRKDRVLQVTRVVTRVTLTVPGSMDTVLCERVLAKAEHDCLIANSLRCERQLQMEIVKVPIVAQQSA